MGIPRRILVAALLPLATFLFAMGITYLIYSPILKGFFISDDFVWLEVAGLCLVDPIHLLDNDVGSFIRPTAHLHNTLILALGGPAPAAFHWSALLIHSLNLTLLTLLVQALSRRRWMALSAGLICAVLPGYHEAMVWVSAINEPLHSLWTLGCLLCWQRFIRRRDRIWFALALCSMALAMGTKEAAIMLPLLMVLVHRWLRRQGRASPLSWRWYLPAGVMFLLFSAHQAHLIGQNGLVATNQFVLEPAMVSRLAQMAGLLLAQTWVLVPVAIAGLLRPRGPLKPRTALTGALYLGAALLLVLLPYAPITWAAKASRFQYLPAMIASIMGAGALTLGMENGRLIPRLLAPAAALALVLLNIGQSDEKLAIYRENAARSRRLIAAAHRLPPPHARVPIHILDCPLPSQHMSAAMAVFHPSKSRDFYCISRKELLALRGPRWVWRWLPKFKKFAVLERRTDR